METSLAILWGLAGFTLYLYRDPARPGFDLALGACIGLGLLTRVDTVLWIGPLVLAHWIAILRERADQPLWRRIPWQTWLTAALIVLPDFFVRFVILLLTRCVYRIRAVGLDRLPREGGALLVSNHASWVDALLLSALTQRRIRFLMDREISRWRCLRPIFRLMNVIPISAQDTPRRLLEALHAARAALDDGYLVCIFAEGALTRNGNLLPFRPGLERIVKGSSYPILPIYIDGAWGSVFSYYRGRLLSSLPRQIPYPVTVLIGPPLPPHTTSAEVRRAVIELAGQAFDLRRGPDRTLPAAFVRTARRCWFEPAVSDTSGRALSFGRLLAGATALATELDRAAPDQERIGLLLPPSVAGALANAAVQLCGRTAVNLNYTWTPATLAAAARQAGLRTILTSRAFLEKLALPAPPAGSVCLEDLAARLGPWRRAAALLRAALAPARRLTPRPPGPDDLAAVIFSSGSTGVPKGVMLSHHNLLSNIDAFNMVLHFRPNDRMAGVLPFFHSFGFTCTLWCPLLSGFSVHYHPNPLDGARIAQAVRERRLTVLLATPTFLLTYLRKAQPEDFASLRLVVAGAEQLKPRLADAFEKRFGVRPLEGYGATELSPVAAVNVPDREIDGVRQVGNKPGSIGHPLPGVSVRIVDPETGAPLPDGVTGLLLIKGPNVMQGYLGQPARSAEALRDGWYVTGDLARVDGDGFVFLGDRLARCSKIGGEMVPHAAVEERLNEALGALAPVLAVTAAPDDRKGEQLVVLCTPAAGALDALADRAAQLDLPNLWKPRRENFFAIEALPLLGSGKLDLARLRELARELVAARAAAREG